jgi:methionyl-tRNA formyltransferase
MDAGDILAQEKMSILPGDTAATLAPRLADLGAQLLLRTLNDIRAGTVRRTPQDEALATRAPILRKHDGRLDWSQPANTLFNHIRGFFPWPGSYFVWPRSSEKRVKVLRAVCDAGAGEPGTVLAVESAGLLVATGRDALRLMEVQPEGKKPMPAAAFAHGARLQTGDRLG